MMTLWGLSIIAVLGEGTLLKGLAAGGFGILLSCVGYDPMTSELRFTFGIEFLWDGIQVVPWPVARAAGENAGDGGDVVARRAENAGKAGADVSVSDNCDFHCPFLSGDSALAVLISRTGT